MLTFGLKTNAEKFLKPYKLKSTPIIIDGNISVKFGSANSGDPRLGGDLQKIYDAVYDFFRQLKACNIIPIVVKRGRFKDDELVKIQTYRYQSISTGLNYKKSGYIFEGTAFPTFTSNVFYDVLNDLGISHCSSDSEETDDIIELAKKTKYALISDKYAYGLCEGVNFIPFKTIKFERNVTESYVTCSIFDRKSFSNGISTYTLPYLIVIFSKAPWFIPLFEHILPKYRNVKHIGLKYELILNWMRKNDKMTCEREMNKALQKTQKKPKKIDDMVKSFIEPKITVISTLMKNEEIRPYLENFQFNTLDIDNGIPPNISNLVKECRLPSTTLDMYTHQDYRCKINPVEDMEEESIHTPAVRIIQGIYGILIRNSEEKKGPMILHMRDQYLDNKLFEKNPLPVPKGELTEAEKYAIVYEILNLKSEENIKSDKKQFFDDDWYIFVLAFTFWEKQCSGKVDKKHVHSIILTAYMLHVLKAGNRKTDKNLTDKQVISNLLQNLTNQDYKLAEKKMKTFITEKEDKVKLTDIYHIHVYLTFQSCLYYTIQVFTLLGLPDKIRISDFISGSFYHSIFTQLEEIQLDTESIRNWFNDCENLRTPYCDLIEKFKSGKKE